MKRLALLLAAAMLVAGTAAAQLATIIPMNVTMQSDGSTKVDIVCKFRLSQRQLAGARAAGSEIFFDHPDGIDLIENDPLDDDEFEDVIPPGVSDGQIQNSVDQCIVIATVTITTVDYGSELDYSFQCGTGGSEGDPGRTLIEIPGAGTGGSSLNISAINMPAFEN